MQLIENLKAPITEQQQADNIDRMLNGQVFWSPKPTELHQIHDSVSEEIIDAFRPMEYSDFVGGTEQAQLLKEMIAEVLSEEGLYGVPFGEGYSFRAGRFYNFLAEGRILHIDRNTNNPDGLAGTACTAYPNHTAYIEGPNRMHLTTIGLRRSNYPVNFKKNWLALSTDFSFVKMEGQPDSYLTPGSIALFHECTVHREPPDGLTIHQSPSTPRYFARQFVHRP